MSENVEYQPVTQGTHTDDTITDLFRMAVRHAIEEKLAKRLLSIPREIAHLDR